MNEPIANTEQGESRRAALLRRGILLERLTLAWNVVGFGVVFWAAWRARSVALAGFGLDSLIEIGASAVVLWELSSTGKGCEKRALRLIGGAFMALAAYILAQSVFALLARIRPDTSPAGIVWLAFTVVAMLALAWGKAVTGAELGNPVLQTEGRVTLIDALLAAAVLVSLLLNTCLGWWWADPVASLVIVFYGVKEGIHSWREGA